MALTLALCTPILADSITEVSGIARLGDKLLIVSDDIPGSYFELKIEDPTASVFPVDPSRLKRVKMHGCEAASDLESICVLTDGRVAVLSEDLHAVFAQVKSGSRDWGILLQLNQSVTEIGNRGMEGIDCLGLPDGSSRLAICWEGGYLRRNSLPIELRQSLGREPLKPILIVHQVARNGLGEVASAESNYVAIRVQEPRPSNNRTEHVLSDSPPDPSNPSFDAVSPPFAQRYRVPDLVWHTWPTENGVDTGVIVIQNSENAPLLGSESVPEYKFKTLQRFRINGEPFGSHIDINDLVMVEFSKVDAARMRKWSVESRRHFLRVKEMLRLQNWENVNWEGLAWFEPGKSLIVVYDGVPADPPFAVVIPIPDDWKQSNL